jgi:RNA polymerase sigma-70 factor (ECF subfamily)
VDAEPAGEKTGISPAELCPWPSRPRIRLWSFVLDGWIALALPGAVAYATSLVGDRTQGEDIVQDCVCRLLVHAARYDLARDGRKLLFRAITNACINRRTRQRKTVSLDEYGRAPEGGTWELVDTDAVTPPVAAMAEELRSAIAEGLQSLGVRYRAVLELSSLGNSPAEIAEIMDVSSEHVRVLLFRARRSMAEYLNARFSGGVSQ